MSVNIEFRCDGCSAVASGKTFISRERRGLFSDRALTHGGFTYCEPWNVDAVVPDGWVACDPYTGCCYCPKCWAGIIAPEPAKEGSAK